MLHYKKKSLKGIICDVKFDILLTRVMFCVSIQFGGNISLLFNYTVYTDGSLTDFNSPLSHDETFVPMGVISSGMTSPYPQGMRTPECWQWCKSLWPTQLVTYGRFSTIITIQTPDKWTFCGRMMFILLNATVPKICRIYAKAQQSYSDGLWWPNTLLRHFISVLHLTLSPVCMYMLYIYFYWSHYLGMVLVTSWQTPECRLSFNCKYACLNMYKIFLSFLLYFLTFYD